MPQAKKRRPSSKQQKSGGDKNKNKNKSKSKGKGKGKEPKVDPYDPRSTLTGDTLEKFVKSEVRAQTRPAIRGGKRTIDTLKALLSKGTNQLKGFEEQASGNITQYYKDLAANELKNVAQSQALGSRLNASIQGSGVAAGMGQNRGAEQALAGLRADEQLRQNAPSAARDELQAIIAQQKGAQQLENNALQGAASQQSANWGNLLTGMSMSAQARGGEQLADSQRDIKNRITDLQNQYIPDIREAVGTIKEARASKGDLRRQILMEARGAEREYLLSKGALGIDKQSLEASSKQAAFERKQAKKSKSGNPSLDVAKQYGKNKRKEQKRSLRNQLAVAEAQGDNKRAEQIRSRLNQLAVIEAQGGGGKGGKLGDYDKSDKQRALSIARRAGSIEQIGQNKQKVIDEMNRRYGVNPVLGRWALKRILKKAGGGTIPNTDLSERY